MTDLAAIPEVKPKRKRTRRDSRQVIQHRILKTSKGLLTDDWLRSCFPRWSPSEQLMYFRIVSPYIFERPAPKKDEIEGLSDEQVDRLLDKIEKQQQPPFKTKGMSLNF